MGAEKCIKSVTYYLCDRQTKEIQFDQIHLTRLCLASRHPSPCFFFLKANFEFHYFELLLK